jgi:hypothetical protein
MHFGIVIDGRAEGVKYNGFHEKKGLFLRMK